MENLTKAELIAKVAETTNLKKADVDRVLNSLQDEIGKAVSEGKKVSLSNFASFTPATRAARTVRNPQTGEPLKVEAREVVKIKPLKKLADRVAGVTDEK